ncbi:hypothetical protein HAX54_042555, partial [Datura stramonium]|nr:hypothetical protein [Datura stramonium]
MEEFYIAFKEKHVIHAEAQFDAESFKTACPSIYYHIGTARQQLLKHRDNTKAFPCLTSVWVPGKK